MAVNRIGTTANYLRIQLMKFSQFLVERDQLSWTDECKIQRIKEQDDVFALVIR